MLMVIIVMFIKIPECQFYLSSTSVLLGSPDFVHSAQHNGSYESEVR